MPAFDAIFFDIGSTLIPSAKIIRSAAEKACHRLARAGLIPEANRFFLCYLQADRQVDPPHISHIYSDIRIVREAERLAGWPADARRMAGFLSAYRETMRMKIKLSAKCILLFRALERAGIQRGIISDGSIEGQGEVLARLGLLPFISPGLLFISEDIGGMKDEPEIFRRALAAAKVPAERALMIGDRLDRDVAVPQSVGMQAVLLLAHQAPSFIPAKPAEEYAAVRPEAIFENWNEWERWLRKRIKI